MKKKLIAIVASLAMVATMVPASAFAGTAQTKDVSKAGITAELAPYDASSNIAKAYANIQRLDSQGTANPSYAIAGALKPNDDVEATYTNGILKLKGSIPYTENINKGYFESTEVDLPLGYRSKLQNGNFIMLRTRIQNPNDTTTGTDKGWALVTYSEEQDDDDSLYYNYKLTTGDFTGTGDKLIRDIVRLNRAGIKYTAYYLTADGKDAFELAMKKGDVSAEAKTELRYGDRTHIKGDNYGGTIADLNALLAGDKDGEKYVMDSQEIAIDTSELKLLTGPETKTYLDNKAGVKGFVEAVTGDSNSIKKSITPDAKLDKTDKVTPAYRTKTVEARAKYTGLTAAQKELIDNAAKGSAEKNAYDGLLEAEQNVASYDQIPDVAALIAALPTEGKMDVTNEAQVKQVKDAEAAVKALRDGVQEVLLATTSNDYLTSTQVAKYKKVLEMVNNAAAQTVVKAINALPPLPATEFADKAAIDAVFAPMIDAEKAYKALSVGEKEAVSNYAVLSSYRNNYDRLIKAYVEPIWKDAAKIELNDETPLTDEEIALITELKSYIDGRYIDTAAITDFDQDTYDALVTALNKIEKDAKSLANAEVTVAGADSIVYDGSKKTPDVTVTIGGKEVAADAYDKIYSDNKDAGEAIITIIPKDESGYTGKKEATFTIKPAALTASMVKVANATYTGKALKPAVSVASGVDYTVAYKNNTAVGKASAVVTGTGNYTGTITKNFIVKPAKESITSLKAGTKQITVAYKAQTGAKYRVICKASGLKAIGTNTTATKKTVKKLKSGKTYQVKVRAYKAVDGKTYYGTYSAVKKIKVK